MQTLNDDLQAAAQVAQIGFAHLDADGRFEQINSTYLAMLGRQLPELLGESWRVTVHPDDHRRVEGAYRCALRNGHGYVEIRGLREDGSTLYQAMTVTRRGDDHNSPQGFHCLCHDVSSYKGDQEALMLAVESSPNGMLMLNSAGHIRMVNAAVEKLFGYSRDELLHRPVETLLPARFREQHKQYRDAFNRDEAVKAMAGRDLRGVRKDGIEIPLEVYLNTIDTPAGNLIVATIIDIAERNRYQSQLELAKQAAESANRAKSDFLARMSHEIRTPMNLINGMNTLLLESELTSKQREYVDISYRNVRRLLRLINGILDLSKVEAGKFTLDTVPFDLREVLSECSATIATAVEQKGLQFELHVDPEVWRFWMGDPERLQQVLLNLIGNSVKFTAEGRIDVTVRPATSQHGAPGVQFDISDTGCGIAPEMRSAVFEAFQQADNGMNRSYEGTGLGLSITKTLVELMSGELWLDEKQSTGSQFSFTMFFPRITEESLQNRTFEKRRSNATHQIQPGTLILVAEDNSENVVLLQSYLQGLPLLLDFAPNGKEALNKRCAGTYDLILMDIQMPVMDGYTATGEIRAWEKARNVAAVPIVALTAHAFTGALAQSLRAGCHGHITKPVERHELVEAIAKFAANAGVATAVAPPPPPPSMDDLRPKFLANRKNDVTKLREAFVGGDFTVIQTIAHDCKGIGKGYGYPTISTAGAALEAAAKTRDPQRIEPILREFEETVAACA